MNPHLKGGLIIDSLFLPYQGSDRLHSQFLRHIKAPEPTDDLEFLCLSPQPDRLKYPDLFCRRDQWLEIRFKIHRKESIRSINIVEFHLFEQRTLIAWRSWVSLMDANTVQPA